ncbi:MAG: hypothetical protein P8188_05585 [Gemmatimonadota bacterium]|jgi:hypothetical protein
MRWLEFLSGVVVGVALVWAWRRRRRLLRERVRQAGPQVDDRAVEQILRHGVLETREDEPLDLDEIARAERDFWATEGWDAAEEEMG